MTMPNDNQAAKSYIEAAMARADGAADCAACEGEGEVWADGLAHSQSYRGPSMPCPSCGGRSVNHDAQTLAKMALRAIEALGETRANLTLRISDSTTWQTRQIDEALADINALAAKGSQ